MCDCELCVCAGVCDGELCVCVCEDVCDGGLCVCVCVCGTNN